MSSTPSIPPLLACGPTPALQRTLHFENWDSGADVVRTSGSQESVGGKATNAARAIIRGGGKVSLISFAGGDRGRRIKSLLETEGMTGYWVDTTSETRVCQTLVDADGKRIRELVENAAPVTHAEWETFFSQGTAALETHSGLLLCGSLPRNSPADVYARLIRIARNAGKPVAIDAKGDELLAAVKEAPDLVKINAAELRDATGKNAIATGIRILAEMGPRNILITDGPRPAWMFDGENLQTLHLPAIEPLNPIGGGDTVTGITFLNLTAGKAFAEAAVAGLAAGMAQTLTDQPAYFEPDQAKAFIKDIRIQNA